MSLPITYVQPDETAAEFIGFDLASIHEARHAAMRSARENTIVATARIETNIEPASFGSVAFLPIYRKNTPLDTRERRAEAVVAWIGVALDYDALVTHGSKAVGTLDRIELIDQDDHNAVLASSGGLGLNDASVWVQDAVINVGGRSWAARLTRPAPSALSLLPKTGPVTGVGALRCV